MSAGHVKFEHYGKSLISNYKASELLLLPHKTNGVFPNIT